LESDNNSVDYSGQLIDELKSIDINDSNFTEKYKNLIKKIAESQAEGQNKLVESKVTIENMKKLRLSSEHKEYMKLLETKNTKFIDNGNQVLKCNKETSDVFGLYFSIIDTYNHAGPKDRQNFLGNEQARINLENEIKKIDSQISEMKKLKEQALVTDTMMTSVEKFRENLEADVEAWFAYNDMNTAAFNRAVAKRDELNSWIKNNQNITDEWDAKIGSVYSKEVERTKAEAKSYDEILNKFFDDHKLGENKFYWGY
jgi:hypothetical protein